MPNVRASQCTFCNPEARDDRSGNRLCRAIVERSAAGPALQPDVMEVRKAVVVQLGRSWDRLAEVSAQDWVPRNVTLNQAPRYLLPVRQAECLTRKSGEWYQPVALDALGHG